MKKTILIIVLVMFYANTVMAASGGGSVASSYLPLDPPFVVNISNGSGSSFLQVNTELKLSSPELSGAVMHHSAAIRHIMVLLLSSQNVDEMKTLEGKEFLREEALEAIQTVLEEETGDSSIEAVYFTGFVIQ